VTNRRYLYGNQQMYSYSTEYDLLGRPVNATDSLSMTREWLYNNRNELASAVIGTNSYAYAYDSIGNREWAALNSATNSYTVNSLNQYSQLDASQFTHDADGNLTQDSRYNYTYDAENRLVSVIPIAPTEGSLSIHNRYDHKGLRIRKIVKRYANGWWNNHATHTFIFEGGNIVLERIVKADGNHITKEYFWGIDKSGTEQGAGGVGGLLAVSVNGVFSIPCYDHNGNIVTYISETGGIESLYVYDAYGNTIEKSGEKADEHSFGFSTKYHDREIGMIAYQKRFYRSDHGRWLNRDPIEEDGGENLYAFCGNNPILYYDINGCWALIDNAIAAIGGALAGVACQAISDIIRGEAGGWESYVGAAVAGAAMGEILLHNPAMAGATKVMYSGMAAATGSFVKQVCSVEISKKQESYNTQEIVVDFAAGATFSMIPFPGIKGVNKGQGSYLSIARSMNKKFQNGSISRVSSSTTAKSFVGTATEYGIVYGVAQPYASDKINQGIGYLGDMMTPANEGIKIFYSETLFIRATDKCGNVVNLYYSREISNE
jgi:RHS repeat-associated protein